MRSQVQGSSSSSYSYVTQLHKPRTNDRGNLRCHPWLQADSELSKASTNWLQKQTIEIRIQEIYSCLANLSPLFAMCQSYRSDIVPRQQQNNVRDGRPSLHGSSSLYGCFRLWLSSKFSLCTMAGFLVLFMFPTSASFDNDEMRSCTNKDR